jgi:hypothetical protein
MVHAADFRDPGNGVYRWPAETLCIRSYWVKSEAGGADFKASSGNAELAVRSDEMGNANREQGA